MNREIIIRSLSMVAGGVIGFIVAKRVLQKHYDGIVQDEIDSIREAFAVDPKVEVVLNVNNKKDDEAELIQEEADKKKYVNYARPYSPTPQPEVKTEKVIDRSKPYIITEEEYSEECDNHDKASLLYYAIDGVVADSDDSLLDVDDPLNEITDDISELMINQDCSLVWVRDEYRAIDFEISKIQESYSEFVHGISSENLTPLERYHRNKKKKGLGDEEEN